MNQHSETRSLSNSLRPIAMGIVGACIGAILGSILYKVALGYNISMLALPGAAIGFGCGYLSKIHSVPLAIVCAILAAGLNLYLAWENTITDDSFWQYVTHLNRRPTWVMIMVGIGVVFAYWFGLGRPKQ